MSNRMTAIWGPPDGGKTTLAANLAACLAREDTVLLVSSNLWFPEIQLHFGQVVPEQNSLARLPQEGCAMYELFTPVKGNANLQLLTLPDDYGELFGDYLNSGLAENLFEQIGRYRFAQVIVDCSAVPDNPISTLALHQAETVLHVGTPAIAGLFWYRAMKPLREALALDKKSRFVANHADNGLIYGDIEPDFQLPEIEQMGQYAAQGKTAFAAGVRKYAARIKEIAGAIQREVVE